MEDRTLRNKIRDIFYSGTHAFKGDLEVAGEIAFMVENGYISMKPRVLADKEAYLSKAEGIGAGIHPHDDAAGGGPLHMALKVIAADVFGRERGQNMKFEQGLCGYYPDVLSADKTLAVECGHTQNPEKIFAYFRQGNVQELIQVPYPNEEDVAVVGYSFIPLSGFFEFMEAVDKEKRGSLFSVFIKRRNR
ncbi:MAG TPA: hypothetical protein VJJ20_03030 [Candidatus Paceibacterota bacterium]